MSGREPLDTIAFARRVVRAAGRAAAAGDEFELAELASLRDELEAAIKVAVDGQRATGRSWAHIGSALGITRQSAHERYATAVDALAG